MDTSNPDLDEMHRLLHRHQWSDIADWAQAFGDLADLTDAQIEAVAQPGVLPTTPVQPMQAPGQPRRKR